MASVVRIIPKSTSGVTSTNRVTADYLHSPLVINSTGKTLAAGTVVYAQSSECGCYCEIYPADSSTAEKANPFGVVVETVFNGKTTRVAVGGSSPVLLEPGKEMPVNGATLYLSADSPGTVTPDAPDFLQNSVVEVGKVTADKLVINFNTSALFVGDIGNVADNLILPDDLGDLG